MAKIKSLKAIEILDSRGKPTVRTFLTLDDDSVHSASVPSGASTGVHEAVELRDGNKEYHFGQGVQKAVGNVNNIIADELSGMEVENIETIDKKMIDLDGTENKRKLGANAILSVSMAATRAAAASEDLPLWKFVNNHFFKEKNPRFPRLMVNIVNGGKHAGWNFDIQEFMVVPNDNKPTASVRKAAEIFQSLGEVLKEKKLSRLVGDEGGYSPALSSNEEVLETIKLAAERAGYKNVGDFHFALDCAASEFYENGKYILKKTGEVKTSEEMISYYQNLIEEFSIESIEDPFAEDDWQTYKKFMQVLGNKNTVVVGDDLFVTNPKRVQKGIGEAAANAVLIKLNQIGTVTETVDAIKMAQNVGWKIAVSHRSGETEDSFIADFAYACGADYIKTGSMSRSERLAKYNRLIEIEEGF